MDGSDLCRTLRQHSDNIISYIFSFRGSLQAYGIHMDMVIVDTAHKSNKNICLRSQELKSVEKCTMILVTRPNMMFEDLT